MRTRRQRRSIVTWSVVGALTALAALPLAPPAARASTCAHTATAYVSAGRGGVGEPAIEIATGGHLLHLALAATAADWGKRFIQTADIDLTGCTWTPIGTFATQFTGQYDGGGRTISGLTIDLPAVDDVGMFAWVNGGSLRNMRLVDVEVRGRDNTGALIGTQVSGDVENVHVHGVVSGRAYVGGLIGEKRAGAVRDARTDVTVTATGEYVGGLVGWIRNSSVIVERTLVSGAVHAADGAVGGLAGVNAGGTIAFSSASANVTSTSDQVGGLVGYNEGDVRDSFASGDTTGTNQVGGLVGFHHDGTLARSFATGLVTITAGSAAGGLIGAASTTTAFIDAVVENSFWDVTTTGRATDARAGAGKATGLTTAQMRTLSTFSAAGWSIVQGWQAFAAPTTVWGICTGVNDGYPFLLWIATSDPCVTPVTLEDAPPVTPVLSAGSLPAVPAGQGVWRRADDTSVPLEVSSPGTRQVRFRTDGVRVTFTGASGTGTAAGLVAAADGEIVCEVCFDLRAGEVIEVWLLSRPRLVAARLVDDAECQTFAIPLGAPLDGAGPVAPGAHTLQLALPTSLGMQAINVGVTVGGAVPARISAGEGPPAEPWWLAWWTIAAVGGALMMRMSARGLRRG